MVIRNIFIIIIKVVYANISDVFVEFSLNKAVFKIKDTDTGDKQMV